MVLYPKNPDPAVKILRIKKPAQIKLSDNENINKLTNNSFEYIIPSNGTSAGYLYQVSRNYDKINIMSKFLEKYLLSLTFNI